jgi:hypothetical protein
MAMELSYGYSNCKQKEIGWTSHRLNAEREQWPK